MQPINRAKLILVVVVVEHILPNSKIIEKKLTSKTQNRSKKKIYISH